MAHMPSFRRRGVIAPSASTPVSAVTPAPPIFTLIYDDDDVSPCDGDLRPCNRKVVDIGGVSSAVDSLEGKILIQETVTIHIGDDVGVTSEAPKTEEANADAILCPKEERVTERTIGDDSASKGQ